MSRVAPHRSSVSANSLHSATRSSQISEWRRSLRSQTSLFTFTSSTSCRSRPPTSFRHVSHPCSLETRCGTLESPRKFSPLTSWSSLAPSPAPSFTQFQCIIVRAQHATLDILYFPSTTITCYDNNTKHFLSYEIIRSTMLSQSSLANSSSPSRFSPDARCTVAWERLTNFFYWYIFKHALCVLYL